MCTNFVRFRRPEAIETLDFGRRQVFAKSRIRATLASFSFARALTVARSIDAPSSPLWAAYPLRAAARCHLNSDTDAVLDFSKQRAIHRFYLGQYSNSRLRMKNRARIRIIGEISIPPKFGINRRIGRSNGSVMR